MASNPIMTKADLNDMVAERFIRAQLAAAKAEIVKWTIGLLIGQAIVLLGAAYALQHAGAH